MNRRLPALFLILTSILFIAGPAAAQSDAVGFRPDQLRQAIQADPALKVIAEPLLMQFSAELGIPGKTSVTLGHLQGESVDQGFFLVIHGTCQPGISWRELPLDGTTVREKNGWILLAAGPRQTLLCRQKNLQAVRTGLESLPEMDHTPGIHFSVNPAFLPALFPAAFMDPLPDGVSRVEGTLKKSKVTMQLSCQPGMQSPVVEAMKVRIKEKFDRVDELNRSGGSNLWTRNGCLFIRSLTLKTRKAGITLTARTIEHTEELAVRALLPGLTRFVREMTPEASLTCRQGRDRLALFINRSLRQGEKLDQIVRRADRSRQIPRNCPEGSQYLLDPDESGMTMVRCAVHDGR